MKTTALFIGVLVSSPLAAEDVPRAETSCRELVAQVRPGPSEGKEADDYLENADKAYRDCRGAKFPVDIRAKALFKYAIASAGRKRDQAAIEALREGIGLFDRATGADRELLIEILDYATFLEISAGLHADAAAHSKTAVEIRAEKYGPKSAEVADGLGHLAMVHTSLKEYDKAEALLRDAIQLAEQACGPQCRALVNAYTGMEVLYREQGNTEEATKYAELAQNAVPPRRSKRKH